MTCGVSGVTSEWARKTCQRAGPSAVYSHNTFSLNLRRECGKYYEYVLFFIG